MTHQKVLSILFSYICTVRDYMKRDHTTLKERINKLGLTQKHVAEMCKIEKTVLARMCSGKRLNKERIDTIHNYLDLCKTVFKKGKDFK